MRGVFPKFSATPGSVEHPGPALGEHARSVLTQRTSLTESEISALAERGVTSLQTPNDVTRNAATEEADDD
jgi:crotonobetainyl-CoA:carnitine CoA-transferase CaiB-like acyl-CoA transferase